MDGESSHDTEICIAVRNSTSREKLLYLEPWGDEFNLAVNDQLVFVGHGPREGSGFIVEYLDDGFAVTGWTGSIVHVFSNGQEIGDGSKRPPVPNFDRH